jgi:NADH:ubiquinone reductase (H+-translocating)
VVGAGPTGVEMAGQIAELSNRVLKNDFTHISSEKARVVLVDAAPQVLPPFGEKLGAKAEKALEKAGVEVILGAMVTHVDEFGIEMKFKDGRTERIGSIAKIWAAGVQASELGKTLSKQTGAELDRAGRIAVNPDLTLPGHPEIFVVGDMISLDHLPGVAQVAIQGGKHSAKTIKARLKNKPEPGNFKYFDKGSMATISRFNAVLMMGSFKLTGILAWFGWLVVHLAYMTGFRNRLTATLHWMMSFIGKDRSERTTTMQQIFAREALERVPGGMAALIDDPAEVALQVERRRKELEEQAAEESRLADSHSAS